MALAPIVYQGAVAPESVKVSVKQKDSGVDLTTVTAVSYHVRRPDGTEVTWSAIILSGATAKLMDTQHTFSAGDVDQLGSYVVVVYLTIPSGIVRATPAVLTVQDPFGQNCPAQGA